MKITIKSLNVYQAIDILDTLSSDQDLITLRLGRNHHLNGATACPRDLPDIIDNPLYNASSVKISFWGRKKGREN